MDTFTLQNETLRLAFDRTTVALVRLTALPSGWPILDRPNLGLSFRLLVPLASDDPLDVDFAARMGRPQPSRRNNAVYGEKQTLSDLQIAPDGTGAIFTWDNVVSEPGGPLPIKVVLTVTSPRRPSTRSRSRTASAHRRKRPLPVPGRCVQHLLDGGWLQDALYTMPRQEWSLWPTHQNFRATSAPITRSSSAWDCPRGTPTAPLHPAARPHEGLLRRRAAASPELVAWHTELRPGYGSSIDARCRRNARSAGWTSRPDSPSTCRTFSPARRAT